MRVFRHSVALATGLAIGSTLFLTAAPQALAFAPTVTLLAANSAPLVGQPVTARGQVNVPGITDVAVEVRVGNNWARSQVGVTSSSGEFTLPLTYGRTSAGATVFRLRATVETAAVYSRQFTVTRRATDVVLVSAPTSAATGQAVTAHAKVTNLGAGRRVTTQFLVGKAWVASQVRTTNAAGQVSIPLTYGQASSGKTTWRLVSTNPWGVTSTTRSYTLTRVGSVEPVISDSRYSVSRGPNVTNRVVLTFDDCPKSLSAFKATVLAAEAADVGLALFPTGACMSSGNFDASFARAHGMHVFNHSVSHPDLRTLSYAGVRRELSAPGIVTTYGRPPYGSYNANAAAAYRSLGMRMWTWTVDTNDWRGHSQSQVVSYVIATARSGDTVLMHMQWNGFNGTAIKAMKAGLARKGVQTCRNFVGTVPTKPTGMWC